MLLAMALVLALRLALAPLSGALQAMPPPHPLSDQLRFLENPSRKTPRAVFFGSSRIQAGLDPELFAGLAGFDPETVWNLASESGTPWEALALCRKAPVLVSGPGLVVIGVEPWMFNQNEPGRWGLQFDRLATLREKWRVKNLRDRARLVSRHLLGLPEKRPLDTWLTVLGNLAAPPYLQAMPRPLYHQDPALAARVALDPKYQPRSIVRPHMENFVLSPVKAGYLTNLLDLLRTPGRTLVLFMPPARKEYLEAISQDPVMAAGLAEFRKFVQGLAKGGVRLVFWETAGDCGLDESIFLDYGHLSRDGGQRLTEALSREMESWEDPGTVRPSRRTGTPAFRRGPGG